MFTGDLLSGKKAAELGVIGEAVPDDKLDQRINDFIARIITVPTNQLFFQKQVIILSFFSLRCNLSIFVTEDFAHAVQHTVLVHLYLYCTCAKVGNWDS